MSIPGVLSVPVRQPSNFAATFPQYGWLARDILMAAERVNDTGGSAGSFRDDWSDESRPADVERYRAWIAAKLFQGLGILVLIMVAVVLFDSW